MGVANKKKMKLEMNLNAKNYNTQLRVQPFLPPNRLEKIEEWGGSKFNSLEFNFHVLAYQLLEEYTN